MKSVRNELNAMARKISDGSEVKECVKMMKKIFGVYKSLGCGIAMDKNRENRRFLEDVCDHEILRLKGSHIKQEESFEEENSIIFVSDLGRKITQTLDLLDNPDLDAEEKTVILGLACVYLEDEGMRKIMRREKIVKKIVKVIGSEELEKQALCAMARFTEGGSKFVISAVRSGMYKKMEKYVTSTEDEYSMRCCVAILSNMCIVYDYSLMLWCDGVFGKIAERLCVFLRHLVKKRPDSKSSVEIWRHVEMYSGFVASCCVSGNRI